MYSVLYHFFTRISQLHSNLQSWQKCYSFGHLSNKYIFNNLAIFQEKKNVDRILLGLAVKAWGPTSKAVIFPSQAVEEVAKDWFAARKIGQKTEERGKKTKKE